MVSDRLPVVTVSLALRTAERLEELARELDLPGPVLARIIIEWGLLSDAPRRLRSALDIPGVRDGWHRRYGLDTSATSAPAQTGRPGQKGA